MNNKKRQNTLYKMKAIVEYFKQPKEDINCYADDTIYVVIKPQRVFNGYKVIEAQRLVNPETKEYWYLFNKSKAIRV